MSDRIEIFFNDQVELLKSNNTQKIKSEVHKFTKYLFKHQNDVVEASIQTKLLIVVEKYAKYCSTVDQHAVKDAVEELIGLILALPEGKLISSKSKKKALSWYDSLCTEANVAQFATKIDKFGVIDVNIDDKTLVLLSETDTDHCLEHVKCESTSLFDEICTKFNDEENVIVGVSNAVVVNIQT